MFLPLLLLILWNNVYTLHLLEVEHIEINKCKSNGSNTATNCYCLTMFTDYNHYTGLTALPGSDGYEFPSNRLYSSLVQLFRASHCLCESHGFESRKNCFYRMGWWLYQFWPRFLIMPLSIRAWTYSSVGESRTLIMLRSLVRTQIGPQCLPWWNWNTRVT